MTLDKLDMFTWFFSCTYNILFINYVTFFYIYFEHIKHLFYISFHSITSLLKFMPDWQIRQIHCPLTTIKMQLTVQFLFWLSPCYYFPFNLLTFKVELRCDHKWFQPTWPVHIDNMSCIFVFAVGYWNYWVSMGVTSGAIDGDSQTLIFLYYCC